MFDIMDLPDSRFDKVSWTDTATGLHCQAMRNALYCWCGYVELPSLYSGNPDELEVHGGVTFNGLIDGRGYLGFDCSHLGDQIPGNGLIGAKDGIYRDLVFVMNECADLASNIMDSITWDLNAHFEELDREVARHGF